MTRAVLLAVALLALAGCAMRLVQHQDHTFEMQVVRVSF